MNTRHRIPAICLSVLLTTFLGACSSEPAASAAAAATSSSSSVAGGARQSTGGQSAASAQATGPAVDATAEYVPRCKDERQPSLACEVLRSLVVADVALGLRTIEKSRDKRGAQQALAALEQADEPDIVIAACRILGRFPETPGLAAKMLPFLLDSTYKEVQNMAANVLIANPDPGFQDLGRLWMEGHSDFHSETPYDEYPDFPAHYASMGFPKYAGAEWFSPADSDRSIGWSTKDDAAAVAKWYGDTLHADVLDAEKWVGVYQQQMTAPLQFDQSKMTRMQQLMERVGRGDQAATAEFEKLQKEIDDASKAAGDAVE